MVGEGKSGEASGYVFNLTSRMHGSVDLRVRANGRRTGSEMCMPNNSESMAWPVHAELWVEDSLERRAANSLRRT